MNQNKTKTNLKQFKTFKGIHVTANKTYYLCDFYFQKDEQNEDVYLVNIETPKHIKSEHQFVFSPILKTWVCTNPDEQPKELIEKIIAEIIKTNKY
jgi:hypothetical protein